jgi:RNA polymerase sigma factor (sigma-70 family)
MNSALDGRAGSMANAHLGNVLNHIRGLVGHRLGGAATDEQLLERFILRGEEASFAALVHRHGGMVLGLCRRILRDEEDAEDAFQATFLVLARKAASIRKQASLASWLYGVAHRIASKARAEAARRRARELEIDVVSQADPVVEVVWRELRAILDEEVSRLPDKYRHPVVLCYLENMTNVEAARRLGWTKGTLSGRLARARALLRRRLARRGLLLSSGILAAALAQQARAAVPVSLGVSTVKAAAHIAASPAAAGAISAPVAAMVQGVLQAMLITKLKITAGVLLAVGVLATGAGMLTAQVVGSRPAAVQEQGKEKKNGASPAKDDEIARLKQENEQLRKELEKTKAELQALKAKFRAAADRADAARAEAEAARAAEQAQRQRAEEQRRKAQLEAAKARQEAEKALRDAEAAAAAALKERERAQQALEKARLEAERRLKEEAERKKKEEEKARRDKKQPQ